MRDIVVYLASTVGIAILSFLILGDYIGLLSALLGIIGIPVGWKVMKMLNAHCKKLSNEIELVSPVMSLVDQSTERPTIRIHFEMINKCGWTFEASKSEVSLFSDIFSTTETCVGDARWEKGTPQKYVIIEKLPRKQKNEQKNEQKNQERPRASFVIVITNINALRGDSYWLNGYIEFTSMFGTTRKTLNESLPTDIIFEKMRMKNLNLGEAV